MCRCSCPSDPREIPPRKRVEVIEPGAILAEGRKPRLDRSRVHTFHADCPVHGYTVLDVEEKDG